MSHAAKRARYRRDVVIGEGTYAVVYKGTDTHTDRAIAIKKIKVAAMMDGMDLSAIRELKFLQELQHPNIIELIDVYVHRSNLNLVLEFLDTDLEKTIKDRTLVFQHADIKSWMMMMLRGLAWCHKNWVLHRDLKPNNMLIARDGQIKLADFGLARDFGHDPAMGKMTSNVITIWYRPPELLLGAKYYSYSVDIWSMACIFAELMLRVPIAHAEREIEMLEEIFKRFGTPAEEDWQYISALPSYFPPAKVYPKPPLKAFLTGASDDALDLLEKMYTYNPLRRPAAEECLKHPYFVNLPRPTPPEHLPKPVTKASDVQTKAQVNPNGAGAKPDRRKPPAATSSQQRKPLSPVNNTARPPPPSGFQIAGAGTKRKLDPEDVHRSDDDVTVDPKKLKFSNHSSTTVIEIDDNSSESDAKV
ncbi:TFIIH complex serine/threonine-protein kinase subunit kin28 [Sorochytrium milnesiophthora]